MEVHRHRKAARSCGGGSTGPAQVQQLPLHPRRKWKSRTAGGAIEGMETWERAGAPRQDKAAKNAYRWKVLFVTTYCCAAACSCSCCSGRAA